MREFLTAAVARLPILTSKVGWDAFSTQAIGRFKTAVNVLSNAIHETEKKTPYAKKIRLTVLYAMAGVHDASR